MDRIAVIGCGGSGKTTVARRLGAALGAPVTHLDSVFYDADWNPLDHGRFAAVQRDLVAAPRWIIDGNYASTLPIRLAAADTVIFLDLPATACLWGVARRRLANRADQNPEAGIYNRVTWEFVRYVGTYRTRMAPRVRRMLAEHAGHAAVHAPRSRRGVAALVAGMTAVRSGGRP